MDRLVIGILAHVDAGKTTLSESMLFQSGRIEKMGRVDHKDAYLDTYELEKARGITIFSKQAIFDLEQIRVFLLDTPGHVDFSAEMERTLQVLDYAILVISGREGVQGHTKTLWRLLERYAIPVFIFVNKMDQEGAEPGRILSELKRQLDEGCADFSQTATEGFYEELAMSEEGLMETYLKEGVIETTQLQTAVRERRIFPCYFGSALKSEGVEQFLKGLEEYTMIPSYPEEFGAKIFKISRDEQGNRLTYMKLTGGKLKVRDTLTGIDWEEKVNQIRLYSGQRYEPVNELEAGCVCAVTGLGSTRPGEGIGIEKASAPPLLEPVLSYRILLPEGCDPRIILPKLRQLEEEEPELHVVWEEELLEIQVQIMGEVQLEILQSLILTRFGIQVGFDSGQIVYKETITDTVEGVGHFEPLRHYAEVHLLLKPGERGSGLKYSSACSEDILGKSWQRLIISHLYEKAHKGVLTGAYITDMDIILVSGRAHNKHTEGGDFREATWRAVRQGLMETKSVLLEPFYSFSLELPEQTVGRAMTDIEKMHGTCVIASTRDGMACLVGCAPVITMRNYQKEVIAYTRGLGSLTCNFQGYEPCHNAEEVIKSKGYDPERDVENPAGSVFCAQGTGFLVDWKDVKRYMHVESSLKVRDIPVMDSVRTAGQEEQERWISLEEIDQIINKTFYANQGKKSDWKKQKAVESYYRASSGQQRTQEIKEEYLLVDGYNIIYAWPDLRELAADNMDGARMKLLDVLCNYQGIRQCRIIVVFDAYRIQGHEEETISYHNIQIVYTREAQTADQYIERFAHKNSGKYRIAVATSDGLQQIIIRGAGCALLSASELKEEIAAAEERLRGKYENQPGAGKNRLMDLLSLEQQQQVEELRRRSE